MQGKSPTCLAGAARGGYLPSRPPRGCLTPLLRPESRHDPSALRGGPSGLAKAAMRTNRAARNERLAAACAKTSSAARRRRAAAPRPSRPGEEAARRGGRQRGQPDFRRNRGSESGDGSGLRHPSANRARALRFVLRPGPAHRRTAAQRRTGSVLVRSVWLGTAARGLHGSYQHRRRPAAQRRHSDFGRQERRLCR